MEGNEGQFNRFCAEVIGVELYAYKLATEDFNRLYIEGGSVVYDPYNDLNQLADAADALRKKYLWSCQKIGDGTEKFQTVNSEWFMVYRSTVIGSSLKYSLRQFIWAVMAADKLLLNVG